MSSVNQEEYYFLRDTAEQYVGLEFIHEEKLTLLAKKKVPVTYRFVSVAPTINFNEKSEKRTYRALGWVENIKTGQKKRLSLRTIINAFSPEST